MLNLKHWLTVCRLENSPLVHWFQRKTLYFKVSDHKKSQSFGALLLKYLWSCIPIWLGFRTVLLEKFSTMSWWPIFSVNWCGDVLMSLQDWHVTPATIHTNGGLFPSLLRVLLNILCGVLFSVCLLFLIHYMPASLRSPPWWVETRENQFPWKARCVQHACAEFLNGYRVYWGKSCASNQTLQRKGSFCATDRRNLIILWT